MLIVLVLVLKVWKMSLSKSEGAHNSDAKGAIFTHKHTYTRDTLLFVWLLN